MTEHEYTRRLGAIDRSLTSIAQALDMLSHSLKDAIADVGDLRRDIHRHPVTTHKEPVHS